MLSLQFLLSSPINVTIVCAGYLLLVQLLRYRRQQHCQELFRAKIAANDKDRYDNETKYDSSTAEVARQVVDEYSFVEFPFVHRKALEFALFRTYAIPSISALLVKTRVFQEACGKRYDDTDLLLAELIQNTFSSQRSITALERINAIHSMYKSSISNEDMIYVLSVFIFEPIRWIKKVEWRELTREEQLATFIAWTHIGGRMGIRNIPKTLEEYEQWNTQYEQKYMIYSQTNSIIGGATMDLFLTLAPSFVHPLARQAAYCLMDARLRAAMDYPDPNRTLQTVVEAVFWVRKIVLHYFALPRMSSTRRTPHGVTSSSLPLCPRYHVYERTYAAGYETDKLGTAPPGKLMKECPIYK